MRQLPLVQASPAPRSAAWHAAARRARMLSWLSLAWMGTEGVIGVATGVIAGSIALTGFGINSFVEGFASVVIVWRFTGARLLSDTAEARHTGSSRSSSSSSLRTSPTRPSRSSGRRPSGRELARDRPRQHERDRNAAARPRQAQARAHARLRRHARRGDAEHALRLSLAPSSPDFSATRCSDGGGSIRSPRWLDLRHRRPRGHRSAGAATPAATAARRRKPPLSGGFRRADDGTRTHDLLHGKQTL